MKLPEARFRENPADIEEAAYQRAEVVREEKMKGRRMADFVDGVFYTVDAVEALAAKVVEYEQVAKDKLADAGEYVYARVEKVRKITACLEAIALKTKTWFGPTSEVYPTTPWDRIQHGVDLVVEPKKGGDVNHHGFALDVTFGKINHILEKVSAIAEFLKKGKLGKVDFFKTADGKFKGQLGEIPLVVIGADELTMKDLMELFADHEDDVIEKHPVQFQFFAQVIAQCNLFIELAKTIQDVGASEKIRTAYETLKADFERIQTLKEKVSGGVKDTGKRDTFHQDFMHVMDTFRY